MSKALVLTAYNRPNYLERVLASLKQNDCKDWQLLISVEPGSQEVISIVRAIDFLSVQSCINGRRFGVRLNPFVAIEWAVQLGCEDIVVLEDDVVLSPDALSLANWFFSRPAPPEELCLCLMNYKSSVDKAEEIQKSRHFIPLGWCVRRAQWLSTFRRAWFADQRGWDFGVNEFIENHPEMTILQPSLARSNHIGREGGTHCSTSFHDSVFEGLSISDGTRRNYSLI